MSVGVPIKVLHDAEGHIITIETVSGEVIRGKLIEAEDNMNIHMSENVITARDGRTSNLQQNSPMLRRPQSNKGLGTGGRAALSRGRGRFVPRGRGNMGPGRGGIRF